MPNLSNEYKAGLFDGEGYVGIYHKKKGNYYTIRVIIGLVDYRPLEFLKQEYGGSLWLRPEKGNCRPFKMWYLTGTKVLRFLQDVHPYLIIKKEQVDLVFEFRKYQQGIERFTPENDKRNEYWGRLKAMHHVVPKESVHAS